MKLKKKCLISLLIIKKTKWIQDNEDQILKMITWGADLIL